MDDKIRSFGKNNIENQSILINFRLIFSTTIIQRKRKKENKISQNRKT